MNKKTWIWLGVGVAVAVAIYFITKDKTSSLLGASGIPAPDKHSFSGRINKDGTNLFKNADGNLIQLKAVMNNGEKVQVYAQADGMYKVDCDGIWIDQSCITIDPEFRNFTGERLEPEQDYFTGKIF